MLSQSHDHFPYPVGFGRGLGSFGGRQKELPLGVLPEVVTENAKAAWGVAEAVGHFGGGEVFDKVSAERLVLAVGGVGGFQEVARHWRYL